MLKYIYINERKIENRKQQEIALQERIKNFKKGEIKNERIGDKEL